MLQKDVWKDEKTVNVMVTGIFSKVTKIMVTALKFFLGTDADEEDEESDDETMPTVKEVALANRVNKKTKKREKMLQNIKKAHKKKKKKDKAPVFNFSALHLIHDPQDLAEKLFRKLETLTEKFEVKLMLLELVSRLIGIVNAIKSLIFCFKEMRQKICKTVSSPQNIFSKMRVFNMGQGNPSNHPLIHSLVDSKIEWLTYWFNLKIGIFYIC